MTHGPWPWRDGEMRVDPCARVTTLTDTRMAIMTRSRARKAQVAARSDARADARAARAARCAAA